ncbi:sensor domain-containing diguanylate cyclase [Aquabacterium sp. A7-Y]|uniref:sensor domain-containing diguanylate cyclase n=1 Tax=Aquabacterium sp. A7-Y TaxID=1349605 RepID=UPI00223CD813|nr:diguanylate cyclase [Aquabacterium sp. A7-Y]MCW7541962.1 sensor domain-containing diguanylate cyclase [Aquabacterium sp. A7-Y]
MVALWLLACGTAFGAPAPALQLDSPQIGSTVGRHLAYLEDPDGTLALDDVRSRRDSFRPSEQEVPNFSFTKSVYWFHLRVENRHAPTSRWLLEAQYPLLDKVRFYALRDGVTLMSSEAGRLFPFHQRPLRHRNLVYPLDLPAGQALELYWRVETDSSLQLPLVLWTPEALTLKDRDEQLAFGFYYGLLAAMLLFNALVYLSMRDISYLHYVQYISGFAVFLLSLNGLASEYLWPDWPRWGQAVISFSMLLAWAGAANFARSFLNLAKHLPVMDRFTWWYARGATVLALVSLFMPYSVMIRLTTVNGFVMSITMSAIGFVCMNRGVKQARFFMLAWATLLLGLALYPLKTINLLPNVFITEYSMQIGSALEALLLSFALAHRMKLLEQQNRRIQAEATSQLEQRVQQRTQELDEALRHLSDANNELQKLNVLDGLTGVKNRKYFDEQLHLQLKVAGRSGLPLSLLLIDIDHFKAVNDRHGHLAGDACLRAVARAIGESLLRPGDQVARYGGEEFAVLLPQTDAEGAQHLGERIRSAIEQLTVTHEGCLVPLTASIGVAIVAEPDETGEQLIAAADTALYAAKHHGRNQVRIAGTQPPPAAS